MLQITPQMKILVAVEPADFRRGIDGLARLCQETLQHDPFAGTVFVFRNRKCPFGGRGKSASAVAGRRIPTASAPGSSVVIGGGWERIGGSGCLRRSVTGRSAILLRSSASEFAALQLVHGR
jgi:hypothetical protein